MSEATKDATPVYASASISQNITSSTETILNNFTSQVAKGITVGGVNVFTTPTPGWYSLGFSTEFDSPSGFKDCILRIKRNGSTFHELLHRDSGASGHIDLTRPIGGSILINMTDSDDIITFTAQSSSSSYSFTGTVSLVKVD